MDVDFSPNLNEKDEIAPQSPLWDVIDFTGGSGNVENLELTKGVPTVRLASEFHQADQRLALMFEHSSQMIREFQASANGLSPTPTWFRRPSNVVNDLSGEDSMSISPLHPPHFVSPQPCMSSPRASPSPGSPVFQVSGEDKMSISSPHVSRSRSPSPPRSASLGALSGEHHVPTSPSPGPLSGYSALQGCGEDKMCASPPQESHSLSTSPAGSPLSNASPGSSGFTDLPGDDNMAIMSPRASRSPSPLFNASPGSSGFTDLPGDDNMAIMSPRASRSPSPLPPALPSFQGASGEDSASAPSRETSPCPSSTGYKPRGGHFLLPRSTPGPGGKKKKDKPRAEVEFVLQSPQKARSVGKPGKLIVPKPYTPEILLKNMDALGIKPMDPNNKEEVWKFFELVANMLQLVQGRDKSIEERPGCIPGYDNVLKDWVPRYGIGDIPSKMAALSLTDEVRLLQLYPFSSL